MSTYARVRTDNMSGTVEGKNLVSLKCDAADLQNGSVVAIGDYLDGEREVRAASQAAVGAAIGDLAVIATPEVIKNKTYYSLSSFVNEKGTIMRGYRLTSKDTFSITKEAFANTDNTALKKGSIVEVNASDYKWLAVATATSGSTTVGKIAAVEDEWYVIEIA